MIEVILGIIVIIVLIYFVAKWTIEFLEGPKNKYRITKHDRGYVASVWMSHIGTFAMIDKNGSDGVARKAGNILNFHNSYVCESEAEAGRRINLHATDTGSNTIWQG